MEKFNLSKYKAVILAGGKGTRLYPITYEIPKPLLPIKKKPIINYLIDLFYSQGVKDIAVLISSSFKEEFNWWKKRYYSKNKIRIIEEKKPLGTFGGLYLLKNWIGNSTFFLANGDDLGKVNLNKMSIFHHKMAVPATIALVRVSDAQSYGVVICKDGIVQKFLEKPSLSQISKKFQVNKKSSANYINSGLYLFSPEIFNFHPGRKFSMVETDLFPKLAKEGKLAGFKFKGKWIDTGTFERYGNAIKNWK